MRAVFLTGIRGVEVRDVPSPRIERPTDVLLAVEVVGMCGSDMHYYKDGRIGSQVVEFPWIVGHECAGTVLEAGPEAGLKVDGRVAVDPLVWCMECDQCRAGRYHTCRNQAFLGCPGQLAGSLAERLVMPAASCFPIPDGMTFERAALTEPFAIALHAAGLADIPAGGSAAILGAGPIGLCVLAALRAQLDVRAYVTELLEPRLALARRMGARAAFQAAGGAGALEIATAEPLGVDVVFECAGRQETLDEAVELLKPGGQLVLVGIPAGNRISLDMNLLRRKELRVQNVRRQNERVPQAIEMVHSGRVDLDPLVTHRFPLAEAAEAFELVADYRDGVVKAMVRVA